MTDTRKILEMLHARQVTVDQALDLLAALEAPKEAPASAAKMIRIVVEAEDEAIVRVNVPAPLAKFALGMIPKEVRGELQAQGIDLGEFLTTLQGDLPEGRLVDVEAEDDGRQIRVVIEVT